MNEEESVKIIAEEYKKLLKDYDHVDNIFKLMGIVYERQELLVAAVISRDHNSVIMAAAMLGAASLAVLTKGVTSEPVSTA